MPTTWWGEDTEETAPPPVERYQLSEELGRGGMGRVLLGFDTLLQREVAIKLVLPGASDKVVQRFLAEARLTAALQHPSIVPIHDAGQLPDGTLFYVMKRIRGETLEALFARTRGRGRLRLVDRLIAVAQAVAHAHAAGILHRDLKPSNVMIGERGETLLVDWGLAQLTQASGGVAGTPGYASPEQARGEPLDARADVWSLGAILYELLTGAEPVGPADPRAATVAEVRTGPPFTGDDPVEIFARTGREPPPAVRRVAPSAPGPLAAIADRALAFDREDRYPSADAFVHDLEAWRDGERVSAYEYTAGEALRLVLRRWRRPLLALGAGLAVAVIVAAIGVYRVRTEQAATARTLAESLVQQGLAADRDGDAVGATAFALAALRIAPSELARGLLVRYWDSFPLRLRAWSDGRCAALGATVCADDAGFSTGSTRVSLPGIRRIAEGAGRILVATDTAVIRFRADGQEEARWEADHPGLVAQDPRRPDRSAWAEGRVVHRSDALATPVKIPSFVSALGWTGDVVLASGGSGEVHAVWADGHRTSVCIAEQGMSRAAFGTVDTQGRAHAGWLGYDGQVRSGWLSPGVPDPPDRPTPPCPEERVFSGQHLIRGFAWSEDGAWLAGQAGDGSVEVWDEAGHEVLRLPPATGEAPLIVGTTDGIRVSASYGIREYGPSPHRFGGTTESETSGIDLAPDGTLALARVNDQVELRDPGGALLATLDAPEGRYAAFVDDAVWVWRGEVQSRFARDGTLLETIPAENMGVQADRGHLHAIALGRRSLAELVPGGWRIDRAVEASSVLAARDSWILHDAEGSFFRVGLDGSLTPLPFGPDTDNLAESGEGHLVALSGRRITVDGRPAGTLDFDPVWVDWVGTDKVFVTGLAEAHLHALDGTCLAIRRSPAGRFWDAVSTGDRVGLLTWDRRVEVWDLTALELDPEGGAAAFAAQTGVRVEGSALVVAPDPRQE